MVQDDLNKKGYSKEEEYFFELNKKLIEKKKQQSTEKIPARQNPDTLPDNNPTNTHQEKTDS